MDKNATFVLYEQNGVGIVGCGCTNILGMDEILIQIGFQGVHQMHSNGGFLNAEKSEVASEASISALRVFVGFLLGGDILELDLGDSRC
jgi:hypothetical protein